MGNVTTWANGFGVWHVSVPRSLPVSERVALATDALREEIKSREPRADPTVWLYPTRVPELDTPDSRVYCESYPTEQE